MKRAIPRTTTMTVRLNGILEERAEKKIFAQLKAELRLAFAAPDSSYESLTAAEVIARNRT